MALKTLHKVEVQQVNHWREVRETVTLYSAFRLVS